MGSLQRTRDAAVKKKRSANPLRAKARCPAARSASPPGTPSGIKRGSLTIRRVAVPRFGLRSESLVGSCRAPGTGRALRAVLVRIAAHLVRVLRAEGVVRRSRVPEPRVVEGLLRAEAVDRPHLEEAQDEIFSALRDVLPLLVRKTYVPLNNRAVKLVQNGVEER